ncbi:uncharacterized protein ACB058_012403 isoform 2-T2 [Synchiropus picturatus]
MEKETERTGLGRRRDQPQNNAGNSAEGTKRRCYTGHIKSEPAGDLDTPLHPDHQMSSCSDSDTDDSEDWKETCNTQSNSNSVENPNVDVREEIDNGDHKSLICSGCGKMCLSKTELTKHKKSCSGHLTCLLCGNSFETRRKLWNHMRIHSGGKPFICSHCQKCFSRKGQRRDWTQNNVGTPDGETKGRDDMGYTCVKSEPSGSLDTPLHTDHQMSLCSESDTDDSEDWREASNTQSDSNSVENPKTDVREETDDADRTSLIYSRCGRKCTSKAKLTQCKKSCSGPLTCSLCGNRFETRRKLWYHMRIHSRGKSFICPQCGKGFSWKGNLNKHMCMHSGAKPFICTQCGKCFLEKAALNKHTRVHTGEKPFSCSQCGECFSAKDGLKRHMRVHTGEKPFICSQCGRGFSVNASLKTHMSVHSGEKPFICSQCGKCFSQNGKLKEHMTVHTGEKPFICSQCGKGFSVSGSLKKHMKVHTGEKPFICSQCGKCYSESGKLKIHMRVHTGEKPFICSQCGKCFSDSRNRKRHMKIHTGEKPFVCSQCGKGFSENCNLRRHMKIHSGQQPLYTGIPCIPKPGIKVVSVFYRKRNCDSDGVLISESNAAAIL